MEEGMKSGEGKGSTAQINRKMSNLWTKVKLPLSAVYTPPRSRKRATALSDNNTPSGVNNPPGNNVNNLNNPPVINPNGNVNNNNPLPGQSNQSGNNYADSASMESQPNPSQTSQTGSTGLAESDREGFFQTDSSQEAIESSKSGNKTVPTKKAMQKLRDKLKAKSNRPGKEDRDSDSEMPVSPMNEFGPPPTITSSPPVGSFGNTGSPPIIHSSLPHAPNHPNYPNYSSPNQNPTSTATTPNFPGNLSAASSPSANVNTMNTLGSPSAYNSNNLSSPMNPFGNTSNFSNLNNLSGSPATSLGSPAVTSQASSGFSRKFPVMTLPRGRTSIQRTESLEETEPFNKDFFITGDKSAPAAAMASPVTAMASSISSSSSFSSSAAATAAYASPKRGRSLSSAANIERPVGISAAATLASTADQSLLSEKTGMGKPSGRSDYQQEIRQLHRPLKVETNAEYVSSPLSGELMETPLTAYRHPIDLKEEETENLLKKIDKGNQKAAATHEEAYEAFTRLENNFGKLNASLTNMMALTEDSLNTVLGSYAPINEESSEIKSTLMTLREGQERLTKEMAQVHEALETEAKLVDDGFAQVNDLSQEYRQTVILGSKPSKTKEIFWIIISWILAFLASVVWVVISVSRLIKGVMPGFIAKPLAVWARTTPYITPSSSTAVINNNSNNNNTSSSGGQIPSNSMGNSSSFSYSASGNFSMPTNPEAWRKRLRAYFDEKNSLTSS